MEEIGYYIWLIRRSISRFFYKKWSVTIIVSDTQTFYSGEIDPENEKIDLRPYLPNQRSK